MPKPYPNNQDVEPMTVGEAAVDYSYFDSPSEQKLEYLRKHLHPTTVAYLEQFEFMKGQPFPYNDEELTDDWTNYSDEDNPAVPDEIIKHDQEVWLNVR